MQSASTKAAEKFDESVGINMLQHSGCIKILFEKKISQEIQ